MPDRLTFFLGAAIFATTIVLLSTYEQFKAIADIIIVIVGTKGSIIAIFDYIARKKIEVATCPA